MVSGAILRDFSTCPSPGERRDLLPPHSSAVLTQIHSLNCSQPSVRAFEKKASVSIWKQAALGLRRSSHAGYGQLGGSGRPGHGQTGRLQQRAPWYKHWHHLTPSHRCHQVPRPPEQPSPAPSPWGHALKSHLFNGDLQGKPDLRDRVTADPHLSGQES